MDADDFIIGERNTGFQFRRFYGLLLSLALIKIGNHNAVIAVFLFQILVRNLDNMQTVAQYLIYLAYISIKV